MKRPIKDVFICHASEDKENVVRPLAEAMIEAGISCWIDEVEVSWGDAVGGKIDSGLRTSRYVIVVLSISFLNKLWAQKEFYAALHDEISSGEIKVLPLIFGSESDKIEIFNKFPLIKDKLYLSWEDGVNTIVRKLQLQLRHSDKADIDNTKPLHSRKKDIVNGVEMVLACQENDSIHRCEEWIWSKDNSVMIKIPCGKFWRGSELGDGAGNEMPLTQVHLDDYFIDKYPITNSQFAQFIDEYERINGRNYKTTAELKGYAWECDGKEWIKRSRTWRDYFSPSTLNHPVIHVSVNDAREYGNWASKQLPTEAQWERAARGDDASMYPWGKEHPIHNRHAKFLTSPRNLTGTVDVFSSEYIEGKSPFGCFHMVGNVWEWCQDYYDSYPRNPKQLKNPLGPSVGRIDPATGEPLYVNRGGSWIDNWCSLRCAYRAGDLSDAYFHVGFRCVLTLQLQPITTKS